MESWNKRTKEGLQESLELFLQATEKCGDHALAHAGVANANCLLGFWSYKRPQAAFTEARKAAERARDLKADLADAHSAFAFVSAFHDWDWEAAEEQFLRAISLDDSYATAHQWYSFYLMAMGRTEQSMQEIEKAWELGKRSFVIKTAYARRHYFARDYDQARRECEAAVTMDPDYAFTHVLLGRIHVQQARTRERESDDGDDVMESYRAAVDSLLEAIGPSDDSPRTTALLGHAYGVSGQDAKARKILAEMHERSADEYIPAYCIALVHLGLGETREALDWLETACNERSGELVFLNVDPVWDDLRPQRRFDAVRERIGLTE